MGIEHDFFGLLEDDGAGGLHWSETVEVGDQPVEIELEARSADNVDDRTLAMAAAMAGTLEGLDAQSRDALIAQLTERESAVNQYLDRYLDEDVDEESLRELLLHDTGDLAVDLLRSLRLLHVGLMPDVEDEGEAFATLGYALDPDEAEADLVVGFDSRGEVIGIDLGV